MRTFAQQQGRPSTTGSAGFTRSQQSTSAPPIVHEVLRSPGKPLDTATRAFMEPRFGHDFSRVRVHTDAKAAQSAHALGAQAYTFGPDIVFGAGEYNPQDSRLLAHELAHHIQQESASQTGGIEVGSEQSPLEAEATAAADSVVQGGPIPGLTSATSRVQRQKAPAAAAPTFSVDQADFLKKVQSAIQQMSGDLVASNTLATQINPILSAMVGNVTWRDEKGKDQGGGSVQHTLPMKPPVNLDLQLILDDKSDPPDVGRFTSSGTSGKIFVRIRKNLQAEDLTLTLFHEALHMMSWFINKFGFSPTADPNAPETRVLRPGPHAAPVRTVHTWLQRLADSVNGRRPASQAKLTDADVQSTAEWIVGEIVVRAETEVFRLASQAQKGEEFIPGTHGSAEERAAMVDNYLFDLSEHFLPTDRAGLDKEDRNVIAKLGEILDDYLQSSVKQRFSVTPFTVLKVHLDPRAPDMEPPLPDLKPTLPSKPSFIGKMEPPD